MASNMVNFILPTILLIFLLNTICLLGHTVRDPSDFMKQPLDHFNKSDNRTFDWYRFIYKKHWKPKGPIFILMAGCLIKEYSYLLFSEIGEHVNALLIDSDLRYYPDSMPDLDLNDTANFKYFSTEQALADVAHLIKVLKQDPELKDSKVIVFGGSYGGNLAVWMRMKYPELVHAAVASSAPVLAKKDFFEAYEKVGYIMKKYFWKKNRYDYIHNNFLELADSFKAKESIEKMKKEHGICKNSDLTIPLNKYLFFLLEINLYDVIDETYSRSESFEPHRCFNVTFEDMIQKIQHRKVTKAELYLQCNELGQFTTTNSDNQPYTRNLPLEFYLRTCETIFGSEFNENRIDDGVARTNKLYGGLQPNVTNVLFVNADRDPGSPLGVPNNLSDTVIAIQHNGKYQDDMFPIRNKDDPTLVKAKKFVNATVKAWVK